MVRLRCQRCSGLESVEHPEWHWTSEAMTDICMSRGIVPVGSPARPGEPPFYPMNLPAIVVRRGFVTEKSSIPGPLTDNAYLEAFAAVESRLWSPPAKAPTPPPRACPSCGCPEANHDETVGCTENGLTACLCSLRTADFTR